MLITGDSELQKGVPCYFTNHTIEYSLAMISSPWVCWCTLPPPHQQCFTCNTTRTTATSTLPSPLNWGMWGPHHYPTWAPCHVIRPTASRAMNKWTGCTLPSQGGLVTNHATLFWVVMFLLRLPLALGSSGLTKTSLDPHFLASPFPPLQVPSHLNRCTRTRKQVCYHM